MNLGLPAPHAAALLRLCEAGRDQRHLLAGFLRMTEMVGPQFTLLIAPEGDGGAIKLIKRVRSVWFHRDYACCNSGG